MKQYKYIITLSLLVLLSACSNVQSIDREDPFEITNRFILRGNEHIDKYTLTPTARGYRYAIPEGGRKVIRSFFQNLYEPTNFINSLLQLDFRGALSAAWRFGLNTTFGFAGLYDFAGDNTDLKFEKEDFGQTIAFWSGTDVSSYLMIPLLGPSTVRDIFGRTVDTATNPFSYLLPAGASAGLFTMGGISTRENLLDLTDDIYNTSFDPYTTIKSAYLQNRKKLIKE